MGYAKRHTRSKTGNRRSHSALKPKRLLVCKNCGAPKPAHRACPQCGKK